MVPTLLASRSAFASLAICLGVTARVYPGFALQDNRRSTLGVGVVGVALFAALATVALVRQSAWLLAAGYCGHGLWDLVHHRHGIDTAMPWWWVGGCLGYDAVLGAYAPIRFLQHRDHTRKEPQWQPRSRRRSRSCSTQG